MGFLNRKTLEGGFSALPADVMTRHGIIRQTSTDDLYTIHKVFDFRAEHVQRVREDSRGYELTFAGVYVYLNKENEEWLVQTRF